VKFTYSDTNGAGTDTIGASITVGETTQHATAAEEWTGEEKSVVAPTTLTTSLSGGGKSGATITVPAKTAVTDSATLAGEHAGAATGTVTYNVYSDAECTSLVTSAGSASVSGGSVGSSSAETLPPGTYFWRASYGGDSANQPSSSTCGSEKLVVEAEKAPPPECSTAVGFLRVSQAKERQKVVNNLSTNLAAPQRFVFTWERTAHNVTLTHLTSASCTVFPTRKLFRGSGQATVDGLPGFTVSFGIETNDRGRAAVRVLIRKPHEPGIRFNDSARSAVSEVIA
jgi:hypothetical protein